MDALDCPVDEILILRNRLLLEPNVQLVLDELHLEISVSRDTLVITQHALRFEHRWDPFAPAEFEAHT